MLTWGTSAKYSIVCVRGKSGIALGLLLLAFTAYEVERGGGGRGGGGGGGGGGGEWEGSKVPVLAKEV